MATGFVDPGRYTVGMGQVVEFKSELQSDQVVVFSAQPFWRERGDLIAGKRRDFGTAREAKVAAQSMALRYAGAIAWGSYGADSVGWWSSAAVIVSLGDVPKGAPERPQGRERLVG